MSPENINRNNNIVNQFVNDFKTHILPHEKEWCLRQYVNINPLILADDRVQDIMVNSIEEFNEKAKDPNNNEVKDTFVKAIIEDFIPKTPNAPELFIYKLNCISFDQNNPKTHDIHLKLKEAIEKLAKYIH